jgi:outer membrane immunogenic protein
MRYTTRALLSALASTVVFVGVASAADIQAPIARAPTIVAPAFSWTGCYIGAHGGYAWGRTHFTNNFTGSNFHQDVNGGLAGGQLGCDYQVGGFVIGIEGQGSWASLSGDSRVRLISGMNQYPGTLHTKVDALGSVAAKLGFALDRAMIYGKFGGAFALDKHLLTFNSTGDTFGETDRYTRWGWVVGTGVEYALTRNWSVNAEYNYMDLGKHSPEFCYTLSGKCNANGTNQQNFHVVKAGVNFRFGGR